LLDFLNLPPLLKTILSVAIPLTVLLVALFWVMLPWRMAVTSFFFGPRQKVTVNLVVRHIEKSSVIEGILINLPEQTILKALSAASQSRPGRVQLAAHFSLEQHFKAFRPEDIVYYRNKSAKESLLETDGTVFELFRGDIRKLNHFMLWGLSAALITKHLEDLGRESLPLPARLRTGEAARQQPERK
jgi:hypothetical protein